MVSGVLYRFKLVLPSLLFLFPIYRFTQRVTSSWINYLRFLERWAWDAFAFIRTVVTGCFRPSRSSRRGSRDLWDGIESNPPTRPPPTPPPPQLTTSTRSLFLIYLLIVSQDFQFPVLPSFSNSNLMVFCSKSLGQIHHPKQLADIYCMPRSWKIPKFQLLRKISYQCQDERVRQFFLNDCLYLLLPGCDVALLLKESNRVPCFLE